MLSKDLYNFGSHVAEYTHGGLTLSSEEVIHFVRMLEDWSNQAQALELHTIPVPLTLNAAHLESGKVLAFPIVPRRASHEDGVAS